MTPETWILRYSGSTVDGTVFHSPSVATRGAFEQQSSASKKHEDGRTDHRIGEQSKLWMFITLPSDVLLSTTSYSSPSPHRIIVLYYRRPFRSRAWSKNRVEQLVRGRWGLRPAAVCRWSIAYEGALSGSQWLPHISFFFRHL